jgi:hypothetical protein
VETIYYGHVPPARDRQPSEGCPRAALRASRGDRNNIPDIVLIVVYKEIYSLVKVLIYNLGLAVSLRVKCSREFNLNPKDTVEFILKI